jgi:TPR repeat protein
MATRKQSLWPDDALIAINPTMQAHAVMKQMGPFRFGNTDVCPRDDKDFTAVQQHANANDPAAQTALYSCYDLGMRVKPNGKESIRLLTKAAGQGYAPAQYEVGRRRRNSTLLLITNARFGTQPKGENYRKVGSVLRVFGLALGCITAFRFGNVKNR